MKGDLLKEAGLTLGPLALFVAFTLYWLYGA
jgi:hypothetical protein